MMEGKTRPDDPARIVALRTAMLCAVLWVLSWSSSTAQTLATGSPPIRTAWNVRYEVPLLELPAFLHASSLTIGGAQVLLQPPQTVAFGESLGIDYWVPNATGWLAMANESELVTTWRSTLVRSGSLQDEIDADAQRHKAPTKVTVKRAKKAADPPEDGGDPASFSEGAHGPVSLTPAQRTGLLGLGEFSAPGGIATGLVLLVLLLALLVSQLRGFEKGHRRRRSKTHHASTRRRR